MTLSAALISGRKMHAYALLSMCCQWQHPYLHLAADAVDGSALGFQAVLLRSATASLCSQRAVSYQKCGMYEACMALDLHYAFKGGGTPASPAAGQYPDRVHKPWIGNGMRSKLPYVSSHAPS